MYAKKSMPGTTAITSAVMALLLSAAGNAAAARPTSPDACSHVSPWASRDAYPPDTCVEYGKRVWANDRVAHPGQKPGVDHPLYIGNNFGPKAKLWFDIGEYVPPPAQPDVLLTVVPTDLPRPVTYVVPASEKTSVYFH